MAERASPSFYLHMGEMGLVSGALATDQQLREGYA
jgi:hypothetical protein